MTLLTAEQAARRLGVKVETVYAYVSRGALTRQRRPRSRASWFDEGEVEALARRGRPRRTTRPPAIDFVVESGITSVTGHTIRYRGHEASRLATTSTFEEVAELLWTGSLGVETWPASSPAVHGLSGIHAVRGAVVEAAAADPLAGDLAPEAVVARARALLSGMVGALPGAVDARTPRLSLPGRDPVRGTIAGRLAARLSRRRPDGRITTAVNAALVLLADHELAASTVAARVAASTRADPYCVVLAGLGAVGGTLHGQASRQVTALLRAAAEDGPADALSGAGRPPGFGHFLYPDGDPRAALLLGLLPRHEVADELMALVRRRSGLEPNVDFALPVLTEVAGMPSAAGEILFSIARSAGWIAHALEEYEAPPLRFRARAVFTTS